MQTTVLGVDAQGRVSADFTGGVVLHETQPGGLSGIDGIGWLDAGSVLRELIYGNLTAGGVHQLLLEVFGDTLVLRDSEGASDFLQQSDRPDFIEQGEADRFFQDPTEGGVRIDGAGDVVHFAAEKVSEEITVYHNLERTPRAVVFGSQDTNVTFAYSNATDESFDMKGQRATAVTGDAAFGWIAIG